MRRLIAAGALVLLLAGCGSSSGRHGISIQIERSPFRVTVLHDGRPVVAEDLPGRLRYQLRGSGKQYALTDVLSAHGEVYRVGTDEAGRTATVRIEPSAVGVRIAVTIGPGAAVQQVYDAFGATAGEHFLGGGERNGQLGDTVDLRGRILPIKVGTCSSAPIPYFGSSAGWGLWLASENVSALAFPGSSGGSGCQFGDEPQCAFPALADQTQVCVQGATLDERIYVGSFAQTLTDYESDAGRPVVPPASELKLIKWRDVVSGPGQVLGDITRLQSAGIPIGWVLLDNPWEVCNGDLTFDRSRIPDPAGLIRAVHARGVEFMLWVSPRATCPQGYPAGGLLGPPGNQILDLRDPKVLAEYQLRLRRLFALGVDGIKGDRADENDLQSVAPGLDNSYPLLFARAVIAEMPKGGAAIFRAATVGSQSTLPGIWAGDQDGSWSGLQDAIVAGETAAMSGFPTWGSDVGGYRSGGANPVGADVFERWAQLGAISPVMEVGGIGPNATPWQLGSEAMAVLRDTAVLHYELYPLFERLLRAGQPVLRPLGYGFPDDPNAWQASNELLVGPDLLAAPVIGPGETPSVYLPPGSWIDLYTGNVVAGGGPAFTRPTPMEQFPFYARVGAVIPFNLRTTTESWWGLNDLARKGYAGFLVSNGTVVDLGGQPRSVQLFVPMPIRPGHVTIGGRSVGWIWQTGPFPGVVIRVHGPTVEGRIVVSS